MSILSSGFAPMCAGKCTKVLGGLHVVIPLFEMVLVLRQTDSMENRRMDGAHCPIILLFYGIARIFHFFHQYLKIFC